MARNVRTGSKGSGCAILQGYIYVEAHKESHVKEAIRGLTCLFYGKGGQLVPMKEMVDAITVKSTAKGSNIGATPASLSQTEFRVVVVTYRM